MASEAELFAKTQSELARFQKLWNQQVQPRLAQNPRVPAQFILDVNTILVEELSRPLVELAKVGAVGKVQSLAIDIAGIAIPGTEAIVPAEAVSFVERAAQEAIDTLAFIFQRVLGPLASEAKAAIDAGGKRATVAIVTSGSDRLDQVVIQSFNVALGAWTRMKEIREVGRASFLFRLLERELEAALAVGRAINNLIDFLVSAGKAIYNTVVGFGNLISTLVKVAVIGGIGYVGYQVYKDRRSAPTPAANPGRRRRGTRARAYLR